MSRRLLLLMVGCVVVWLAPGDVSAHVLIKDEQQGTGAVLHVNPDDDPIAGERASLFFDIHDRTLTSKSSQARLTIASEHGTPVLVPATVRGQGVSVSYIFPRQGLYRIKLVILRDGRPTHTFVQSQRVSRGIIGGVHTQNTPGWAEAGSIATALAVVCTAIIAYNRRRAIQSYSKW